MGPKPDNGTATTPAQLAHSELSETIYATRLTAKSFRERVVSDYRLAVESRETSILCRREVLTGKAKFGIMGDGKELPQIALSKVFRHGDFRSGYYRDQTLMMALGLSGIEQLFAQLYAHADEAAEPNSSGRQMNAHFATHSLDENGNWRNLMEQFNVSSDISCTGGQMPRAIGLALASKKYRQCPDLGKVSGNFTSNGSEVTFVTIGDASTSEGMFWEVVNAASVVGVPMLISVWDDGYGISVPREKQTVKSSISEALRGFEYDGSSGMRIYTVKGNDFAALMQTYRKATQSIRHDHVPVLVHVTDLTQPQGHSTSGSHERYKSPKRLAEEQSKDGIAIMRGWMLENAIATEAELKELESEAKKKVRECRNRAWAAFNADTKKSIQTFVQLYDNLKLHVPEDVLQEARMELTGLLNPVKNDIARCVRRLLMRIRLAPDEAKRELVQTLSDFQERHTQLYNTHLHSETERSALKVKKVEPRYGKNPPHLNGYQILNACFDAALRRDPRIFAFGEDVGKIGDVNQGFAGLQEKYGEERVFDTGIRETTIIGKGIGMAMRGLRPIAEIQYLDYFLYGISAVADDLATLRYRSNARQMAPLIIRSRGHRLEGIWHTGSPMGMLLNAVRGIYLLVPRNMTQAAGFYNTMLQSDDPAIIVECLNGYRLKERMPENIGDITTPLGLPEVLRPGSDLTIVTYGACCRLAAHACKLLQDNCGIDCELIDVQTLLPFDLNHEVLKSVKKTNRLLLLDEDVPGGATAYMLQQIMEVQGAYAYLDSPPATLTARAHRSAYGSDGDYYCKPNVEDIVETVYGIMHETDPGEFPVYW